MSASCEALSVERLTFADIFTVKDGEPIEPAELAVINAYLESFARPQPDEEGRCLKCGTPQSGLIAAISGDGFRWGIAHGEGFCATCGWPGRAYHRITDPAGDVLLTFSAILQYHPSVVPAPPEEASE